ncbi:hypothetical protein Ae201684_002542 [Aphanomyces euteiches]|uniref:Uncharacterized protein n=1 Tax=Aphanomyces euteiches TaxID=100861 RepID=A0A6G0XQ84_9STRA|nr:hypothetical protein Ae201684_002542 [Aphanomyces euteiches]
MATRSPKNLPHRVAITQGSGSWYFRRSLRMKSVQCRSVCNIGGKNFRQVDHSHIVHLRALLAHHQLPVVVYRCQVSRDLRPFGLEGGAWDVAESLDEIVWLDTHNIFCTDWDRRAASLMAMLRLKELKGLEMDAASSW